MGQEIDFFFLWCFWKIFLNINRESRTQKTQWTRQPPRTGTRGHSRKQGLSRLAWLPRWDKNALQWTPTLNPTKTHSTSCWRRWEGELPVWYYWHWSFRGHRIEAWEHDTYLWRKGRAPAGFPEWTGSLLGTFRLNNVETNMAARLTLPLTGSNLIWL